MAETSGKTIADEMREAAVVLRDRAAVFLIEARTNPYWRGFTEYAHGVDNALHGVDGRLAGLFTPELATQLGAWLNQSAGAWDREVVRQGERDYHQECRGFHDEDCLCFDRPLAIAREINKGAGRG